MHRHCDSACAAARFLAGGGQIAGGGAARNVNVYARQGSIDIGDAGSKIGAANPGDLLVQAAKRLSIQGGGSIGSANGGDFTAQAEAMELSGAKALNAANQGAALIHTPSLSLQGTGKSDSPPVVYLANGGKASIEADKITGSGNALIQAANQGDLDITPSDKLSGLAIDPLRIDKTNAKGDINLTGPTLNLTDAVINLYAYPPDSTSAYANGGNIHLAATAGPIRVIHSEIRNRGLGDGTGNNNVEFDTATLQMSNSVVETRTNPDGQGGRISIVNGAVPDSKIAYGTLVNGQFQETGTADWKVVAYAEPNLAPPGLQVQSIFATTNQYKLSDNIRLSATNSVQAALLAAIAPIQNKPDGNHLHPNPCAKEGSSLVISGLGSVVAPSRLERLLEALPSGEPPLARGHAEGGFFLPDEPLKVAALSAASHLDCN